MTTSSFVEMTATAEGGLQTHLTHLPSGAELGTDAPKDNGGNGTSFSPTDLVASGLLA
ncbi:MAG: OsmC family protein [Myxococcaceae bacterium]